MPAGLALFYAGAAALAAPFWRPGLARACAGLGAVGHRVAARPCALRVSLERARLCADLSAGADAERRRGRHLRADAAGRPDLRAAAGLVVRAGASARRERHRRWRSRCCRCSRRWRLGQFGWPAQPPRRSRASRSGSCSRACRSGRNGSPRTRSASFRIISICRTRSCRQDRRSRRHHARGLAGGGDAVHAARHSRGAGRHRQLLPEGTLLIAGALRAERAPPRVAAPAQLLQQPAGVRRRRTAADPLRQDPSGAVRRVSCPCDRCSRPSACGSLPAMPAASSPAPPRVRCSTSRLAAGRAAHLLRGDFPGGDRAGPERPGVIINVTNDGWFGNTTGPRQHLHQARVRAVEEGLPLIRAANNGISAAFDAYGRVLAASNSTPRRDRCPAARRLAAATLCPIRRFDFLYIWLLGAASF